jgi:hypothetical protein
MDSTRDDILRLLRRTPGREYTAAQISMRFRVSQGYVGKCIRDAEKVQPIERRKEGNTVYYSVRKPGSDV